MVVVGNFHNTRILRFLLVLIVVILTIFIYASYSTTATLTSTHMHAAAVVPPTPQQLTAVAAAGHQQQPAMVVLNNTGEFGLSPAEGESSMNNNKARPLDHKKPSAHRLPTIDEDALLDGGAGGASPMALGSEQQPNMVEELIEEPQYVQSIDAITGNINTIGSSSNTNNNNNNINNNSEANTGKQAPAAGQQQQAQQQSQSDVEILMIPTSNLQKFIENADKILKNMTTNSSSSNNMATAPAAAAIVSGPTDKTNQPGLLEDPQVNLLDDNANNQPVGSYAVMPVKSASAVEESKPNVPAPKPSVQKAKPNSNNKAANGPMDPSKGIAAEKIYESGHLNDEIDVNRICPSNGLNTRLLILITSAQTHTDARMSIRQTWGHYGTRRDISMAFVLGRGTNDSVNTALSQENYMYGDLIRGNFIDSYNNLTLKTISSLEWADQHCSNAKYILKTDDDMFINVPKLLTFLKQLEKRKEKRAIYGRLAKKWKPIRNKKSKYYVSTDQFPASVFPSFTTGPAYVMAGHIVHDLYVRSLKTVYLKLEDVFTTGIVAQSLGIERFHVNEFVNRRISFNPCNIRNAISVHMIKSNEQFDLWKKLLDQTTKCK